jgi:hypothetical protein
VIVKKASDPCLQLGLLLQIANTTAEIEIIKGNGLIEEFASQPLRQGTPQRRDSRSEAPQNILVFLAGGHKVIVIVSWCCDVMLRRCEGSVGIARQPVFIVGQGCVGLFEIAKFSDLARRSRNIQESPVLGGSGAVLVCCEHLKRPFMAARELPGDYNSLD